jgi:hypothetical protein
MGWTPRDLTSEEFVRTKLSASDRSYALNSTTRELDRVSATFPQLEKDYLEAQDAFNNRPNRGDINALKATAKNPDVSEAERAAALEKATTLQAERDKLSDIYYRLDTRFRDAKEYLSNLTVGQSNLLQAGAVPPGTSMFAAPPGYEGRKTPPQDVPAAENPNPTPTTTTPPIENSVPTPVGEATQDQANEINAALRAEEQLQVETELGATQTEADFINNQIKEQERVQYETDLGATQAEIDFIKEQEQVQYETELGATQNEADFIAQAQREADANEYAFGGTQAEADFIAQEQKQVSDLELGAGATQAEADAINQALANDAGTAGASRGISAPLFNTRSQATQQDSTNAAAQGDWRVRLSLAPNADYLYKANNPGILQPLVETKGVLFPYTPAISVSYAANYSPTDLVHSNYKIYQYTSSSVDQISITCDFTAQDAKEAKYMLAVIHFFRSVTKMFYGQDQNPKLGTPPPLCYLTGMGQFQFDRHPLVVTNFTMSLPTDVDYIRAANATNVGVNTGGEVPKGTVSSTSTDRLRSGPTAIAPGGTQTPAKFNRSPGGTVEATYVPTKMQMQISAAPIVTRSDISNNFSLTEYATGALLRGSKNKGGAGIW